MDISVGHELRIKRVELKLSMKRVSEYVGVSENYISLIERDKQVPSDAVIRKLANCFEYDERYLFERFGRIPLSITEELERSEELSDLLYKISTDKSLSNDQKEYLYKSLREGYQSLLSSDTI